MVRHKGQQVAPQPWPWQDPDAALELLRRALASTAYFDSVRWGRGAGRDVCKAHRRGGRVPA